jgi:hypothetical protein
VTIVCLGLLLWVINVLQGNNKIIAIISSVVFIVFRCWGCRSSSMARRATPLPTIVTKGWVTGPTARAQRHRSEPPRRPGSLLRRATLPRRLWPTAPVL